MSSSGKPYKSRLFNFLNRQFIKFNSQVSLRVRQLNYLTTTGVKTIISPVFLIWKNWQKKVDNSLKSSAQKQAKQAQLSAYFPEYQLSLPNCDQLICDLNEIIKNNHTIKKLNTAKLPYLACNLDNNNLVLVDQKYQIYDLLSIPQQQELNIFIREIREDYRQNNPFPSLKLPKQNKNQHNNTFSFPSLPKLFINQWQKIKHDLIQLKNNSLIKYQSQEEKILTNEQNLSVNTDNLIKNENQPPLIFNFLDKIIAKLEKLNLFSPAPLVHRSKPNNQDNNDNVLSSQTAENSEKSEDIATVNQVKFSPLTASNSNVDDLSIKERQKQQNLSSSNSNKKNKNQISPNTPEIRSLNQQIKLLLAQSQQQTKKLIDQGLSQVQKLDSLDKEQNQPFEIQRIVWAAIDYFLSTKNQGKLGSLTVTQQQELIFIEEENTEPWLSWLDLFGEEEQNELIAEKSSTGCLAFSTEKTELSAVETTQTIKEKSSSPEKVAEIDKLEQKFEQEGEEIEAKVIEINYEKHFLEIILGKLDQFILWLEEIIMKIWRKLKIYIETKS